MKEYLDAYEKRDGICVSFYPLPKGRAYAKKAKKLMELDKADTRNRKNGIYIHIPFCEKICSFCPFNKFIKKEKDVERYLKALKKEMKYYADTEYAKSIQIDSVYLGGGTPTALHTDQLLDLLETVKKLFHMKEDAVYFVEGNPMNYSGEKLERLADFGVNRISMGVQTFHPELAGNLGLPQTPQQSRQAIIKAHEVGIENVGIDLMYPLPGMNYPMWIKTLQEAISLKVDHVCIIPFCIIPCTPIDKKIRNGEMPANLGQDDEIIMYQVAKEMLLDAGYVQYSVLDFGLPDKIDKAAINYFSEQSFLFAFGPAAYGYLNGYTYFNIGDLDEYMQSLEKGVLPVITGAKADREEEMRGMMAKGLRMMHVSRRQFQDYFGQDPVDIFQEKISILKERGLISYDDEKIYLTEKGTVWGNNVCKEFFAGNGEKKQVSRVDLAKGRIEG